MSRYINKTVILAKIETTSGVDAAPTGAANAIEVSNVSITPLDAQNIELNTILPYFGGSKALVGTASVKCSFSVNLAGSGVAATAPAWGALLQACAMTVSTGLTTPDRVEFSPITNALKTATLKWYDDGVLHTLLGAMGNFKLSAKSGEAPKLTFDFVGVDGGVSAIANPTAVLTQWQTPIAVTRANVGADITLGCTYAAGALSGGTAYNSQGLQLDMGNAVSFAAMLSAEGVDITDRKVTGSISLELTAAQEVAQLVSVKANATTSFGFELGSVAGNKIIIYMPNVQLLSPRKEEINGRRLIGYDYRAIPVAGNDELILVAA